MYFIMFGVLLVISCGLMYFCYKANRLPEGIIVSGSAFTLITIVYSMYLNLVRISKSNTLIQAGRVLYSTDCICKIGDNPYRQCILELRNNGMIVDSKDIPYNFIPYDDLNCVDKNKHTIVLSRAVYESSCMDVEYKFTMSNGIKSKAAWNILISQCEYYHGKD